MNTIKAKSVILDALKGIKKTTITINEDDIHKAKDFLNSGISDADLTATNDHLEYLNPKLRKLNHVDFAAVLVIHYKSVIENNGASPYKRFTEWSISEHNTITGKWDNRHILVMLTVLIALGLTTITKEEDKKKKQCRQYTIANVVSSLFTPTHT